MGYETLERFLSKKRAEVVNRLILSSYRKGRILDIGCGQYPHFLINTEFNEKYGIDKLSEKESFNGSNKGKIFVKKADIERDGLKFFDDGYFDVVTMLAILEHLEPGRLTLVIREITRVLKPGGVLILTTPAPYTNIILQVLSRLRLLNPAMIKEHKMLYGFKEISSMLAKNGFSEKDIRYGKFELFMNIWSIAVKGGATK